jgi:4-hydroxy-tetrahydrodipicolinate synthase
VSNLDTSASGVFVIAATPFSDDGALDLQSVDTMVDFYLNAGATGLTVLGMMGEAPKLTASESASFVDKVLERVAERVPVVVGVSSPGFAAMGELTSAVMGAGAAGVMVAPPPTVRTDDQIVDYYRGVADTLKYAPFVLQDFPLTTNVNFSANVLLTIVSELPTCVMIKHEDWPGLSKLSSVRTQSEKRGIRRVAILGGNGGLFLPEELARGSDGAMTGFAFPEMMVDVCEAFKVGQLSRMRDLFDAYLPLARYEQQPGIGLAVRKYLLAKRGAIASPALRRPGAKLSAVEVAEIDALWSRQKSRLKELC